MLSRGSIVNQRNMGEKRSIDSLDPFKNNHPTECTRSRREKITTLVLDFLTTLNIQVLQCRRFSAIYVIRRYVVAFSLNASDGSSEPSILFR